MFTTFIHTRCLMWLGWFDKTHSYWLEYYKHLISFRLLESTDKYSPGHHLSSCGRRCLHGNKLLQVVRTIWNKNKQELIIHPLLLQTSAYIIYNVFINIVMTNIHTYIYILIYIYIASIEAQCRYTHLHMHTHSKSASEHLYMIQLPLHNVGLITEAVQNSSTVQPTYLKFNKSVFVLIFPTLLSSFRTYLNFGYYCAIDSILLFGSISRDSWNIYSSKNKYNML